MIFKTKSEYTKYQKRTRFTSILCILYHELFVGFACYTAWMSIWPFLNLSEYLFFHYTLYIIGFFPTFIGLFIYFFYMVGMKSFSRAIGLNPDELMTEGIFNISRNPQSLGRSIGLIGIGFMGRSFFTLLIAIVWIILNHFYILIEEKHLESKFGDAYLQYCFLTPRYYKVIRKK
ncbi:MAG: methyltransferase family protein [Candidatus Thorarchaeota archaeon]